MPDINTIAAAVDRIDRRTYDTMQTVNATYKKVDFIESRIREIHLWVKEMRSRYADERQMNKILEEVKYIQRTVDKLR